MKSIMFVDNGEKCTISKQNYIKFNMDLYHYLLSKCIYIVFSDFRLTTWSQRIPGALFLRKITI